MCATKLSDSRGNELAAELYGSVARFKARKKVAKMSYFLVVRFVGMKDVLHRQRVP